MLERAIRFPRTAPSCNLHEIFAEGQRRPSALAYATTTTGEPMRPAPAVPALRDWPELVAHGRSPRPAGDVRPPQRARRLWRRLRGHPHRRGQPCAGRAGADRTAQPRAPRRHRLRARLGRRRRASCSRSRTPSCARSPASSCPRPARTPSASPSCPPTARATEAVSQIETIAAEEGLTVLGWREVPVAPDLLGATAPAPPCPPSASSSSRDGDERRASPSTARRSCCASAPSARPASTSRRSPPARSSTRAC